jgi:hypothetical protein
MSDNTEPKQSEVSNLKPIEESEVTIYWPSKCETYDRIVKLTEENKDDLIKISLGKKDFYSDTVINVECDHTLIFNVVDMVNKEKGLTNENFSDCYTLVDSIYFIDKENNKIILNKDNCIRISNQIFYMPSDLYLAIDLNNGQCTFKNAPASSNLHVKYICFFIIKKIDYEMIKEENEREASTSDEEKENINVKAIEGYDKLTDTQKEQVKEILDNLIFNNENANVKKFKDNVISEKETKRLKVPIKDDGTVDLDLFMDQICPEYAEREIDMSKIEFEDNKIYPVINDKDIRNLGMVGFAPKDLKSLIDNIRDHISEPLKKIDDITLSLEGLKEGYDNAYSTCLSLILNDTYDSGEYNQTIKNNYMILARVREYQNELEELNEVVKSGQKSLASFQHIARDVVNKAVKNGDFDNSHTFASLTVFYKAMLEYGCIQDENDNYGVYIAYLKYVNKKFSEIKKLDDKYFDEVFINSLDPAKNNNVFEIAKELIIRFVKLNDLKTIDKSELAESVVLRAEDRVGYLYDISYYPVSVITKTYSKILEYFIFEKDNDYQEKYEKFTSIKNEKGWPSEEELTSEEYNVFSIIEEAKILKESLNNSEIIEALTGFLKMIWLTVLSEYVTKIMNKQTKNQSELFKMAIANSLLFRIIRRIEAITTREVMINNDSGESEKKILSDNEVKYYIWDFLIELASFTIFISTSLRLNNYIADRVSGLDRLSNDDAQTFFAKIINGIIVPMEILDKAKDKNNEEENAVEIDSIMGDQKSFVGMETVKIFYNGLKGMVNDKEETPGEENKVSRLHIGRKELIKESGIFFLNMIGIVNRFIEDIRPDKD